MHQDTSSWARYFTCSLDKFDYFTNRQQIYSPLSQWIYKSPLINHRWYWCLIWFNLCFMGNDRNPSLRIPEMALDQALHVNAAPMTWPSPLDRARQALRLIDLEERQAQQRHVVRWSISKQLHNFGLKDLEEPSCFIEWDREGFLHITSPEITICAASHLAQGGAPS